ncbi:MAG: flavodoxin family protein [Methanobacterium sp.]
MTKAVIIFGSPRENSNTELLVNQAINGLHDSNVSTEIFYLNEMDIKGCQACYYCKKNNTKECAVKDDMQKIYSSINEADGIIVASPIYFAGITSQTKMWLDRLFPYIDMNVGSLLPKGKKASFIFTQNQPNPDLFKDNIKSFEFMLQLIGFELKEDLIAYNLDKGYKPMVSENKDFLKKAYDLGLNLINQN